MLWKGESLVVLPTETVYGVAALGTSPKAMAALQVPQANPGATCMCLTTSAFPRPASSITPPTAACSTRLTPGGVRF